MRSVMIASIIVAFGLVGSREPSRAFDSPFTAAHGSISVIYRHVPDVFAQARGLSLRPADFDRYIDPSVQGQDRALARRLMAYMPSTQRGDFAYLSPDGRLISNNPPLLRYITVRHSSRRRGGEFFRRAREFDYSNPCSPPDPGTGGPYVRQVPQCGAAAAWGFVNVTCGTTQFVNGDTGYLYMEIASEAGEILYEGGLQYNSDSSIQPYAVESDLGRLSMNNGNVHYACGQNLVTVAGVTWDGAFTFTEEGQLSGSCSPQAFFCNGQEFTPNNGSWLFWAAPQSFASYPGIDSAGLGTPCTGCSVSRVTAIAQPSETGQVGYSLDGSFFGIAASNQASINWMQIAYGEWQPDCYPGTTLCTFDYPSDPTANYGGPQYYPNSFLSQSIVSGIPGYGPYETWDAINMTGASKTLSAGPFNEPLPPLPCTLDSKSYCASISDEQILTKEECVPDHQPPGSYPYRFDYWYQVFNNHKIVAVDGNTRVYRLDRTTCHPTVLLSSTWAPQEPQVQFSDPNLP